MKKIVYIIHGFGSEPERGWRPWLRNQLVARGYEVVMPAMPNPNMPMPLDWLAKLQEVITKLDENTIIVGHSLGANTAMRFLESLSDDVKIGKLITVAAVVDRVTVTGDAEKLIRLWTSIQIDAEKVKSRAGEIVSFFSDNDPFIPLETEVVMREKFGARIIIGHDKAHYNSASGMTESPELLEEILK